MQVWFGLGLLGLACTRPLPPPSLEGAQSLCSLGARTEGVEWVAYGRPEWGVAFLAPWRLVARGQDDQSASWSSEDNVVGLQVQRTDFIDSLVEHGASVPSLIECGTKQFPGAVKVQIAVVGGGSFIGPQLEAVGWWPVGRGFLKVVGRADTLKHIRDLMEVMGTVRVGPP